MFSIRDIIHILLGLFILYILYTSTPFYKSITNTQEAMSLNLMGMLESKPVYQNPYLETLKIHEKERRHPYRYFHDENDQMLPIVAICGFFRDDKERVDMYNEYIKNDIKIIGATMYKTFPKPINDKTGDSNTANDPFDYYNNITDWMCCFDNPTEYGFDYRHNLIDMSESDWYDVEELPPTIEKKYDMIYICLKDNDSCPEDGWNAINRNFDLAQKCFPIIINDFNMKMLVVGRVGCGLEKLYGDKIKVVDFLPFHEFQEKIRESRLLFVPNVYDASPRVISESIIKNVPVIMNKNIVCGSKYINDETGEFFTNEYNIRDALEKMLSKIDKINPADWWGKNYSRKSSAIKLRNFLYKSFPDYLEKSKEIYFYL